MKRASKGNVKIAAVVKNPLFFGLIAVALIIGWFLWAGRT